MSAPRFTLSIALDDDAMQSGDDVARALSAVAVTLASRYDGLTLPADSGQIIDANGNNVGAWEVSE